MAHVIEGALGLVIVGYEDEIMPLLLLHMLADGSLLFRRKIMRLSALYAESREDLLRFNYRYARERLRWNFDVHIRKSRSHLLEPLYDHPFFRIHDVMMRFDVAHLEVPACEFRKVPGRE